MEFNFTDRFIGINPARIHNDDGTVVNTLLLMTEEDAELKESLDNFDVLADAEFFFRELCGEKSVKEINHYVNNILNK